MRALSNSDVVAIWEKGSTLHPLDRGLLLLAAALPEVSFDSLADWPLGRRNRELLALHTNWFGNGLSARASCSSCDEQMEFELDCSQLIAPESFGREPKVVFLGETYRVPTSRDLAFGLADGSDASHAAVRLLESCRLGSHDPVTWSENSIAALGELMAQADPDAETRISFRCFVCGHEQEDVLDITAFLWAKVVAHARRLLREVHTLASAYGWSEEQVLSLGAARRRFYLEMVEA
jgi:hypothetical protein